MAETALCFYMRIDISPREKQGSTVQSVLQSNMIAVCSGDTGSVGLLQPCEVRMKTSNMTRLSESSRVFFMKNTMKKLNTFKV